MCLPLSFERAKLVFDSVEGAQVRRTSWSSGILSQDGNEEAVIVILFRNGLCSVIICTVK